MTQSPTKYVTQIRKQAGENGGMCVFHLSLAKVNQCCYNRVKATIQGLIISILHIKFAIYAWRPFILSISEDEI